MALYDLTLVGNVPECWPGGLAYAQALAQALKVSLSFGSIIINQNEPGPDDRDKVWFRQNSDESLENIYTYFIGPNGAGWYRKEPFIIGEVRIFENGAPSVRWKACDGTAGTLDYASRLIGCTGSGSGLTIRSKGDKVGAETVSLTADQNGPHTHTVTTALPNGAAAGWYFPSSGMLVSGASTTSSSGTGAPHENMPPTIFVPMFRYMGPLYVLAGTV